MMTSNEGTSGEPEWPWSALEIEPTDDVKSIKSAYAKILKRDKANRDPDAFQALKSARDLAVDIAEGRVVRIADDAEPAGDISEQADLSEDLREWNSETDPGSEPFIEDAIEAHQGVSFGEESVTENILGRDLEGRLHGFLTTREARQDASAWSNFFSDMPLLSREQGMFFEGHIAYAVDDWFDGVRDFPSVDVLKCLFDHFQWSSLESQLPNLIGELRVRRIMTYMRSFEVLMER